MAERRTLLIGAVALVRGDVREAGPIMVEICDYWEPKLVAMEFAKGAPFETLHLIIQLGSTLALEPRFRSIDRRNRELPATFEVSMTELRFADRQQIKEVFERATSLTLERAAAKYGLPNPMRAGTSETQ